MLVVGLLMLWSGAPVLPVAATAGHLEKYARKSSARGGRGLSSARAPMSYPFRSTSNSIAARTGTTRSHTLIDNLPANG
uniref:Putative secreted protein n=1 Tax=Anopheles darlingi TaxID=43151 RepID=A0A2M4DLP5_ANODA